MGQSSYDVEFSGYAEQHFIKKFAKQHHNRWALTRDGIEATCERIDVMLQYDRADLIRAVECHKLVKLDFSVKGTKISPKASGNRCILYVDDEARTVDVLLVYSKNDISAPNETVKWKRHIKDAFPDIAELFGL